MMNKMELAGGIARPPLRLRFESALNIITIVSIAIIFLIFTGVSAQGTPTIIKTLDVDGIINGNYVSVAGSTFTDVGSGHAVSNLAYAGYWNPFVT